MTIANWKQLHGDRFTGSRVLLTGGAGFIGSHLCEALVRLGAHVVVLDDLSGGVESNLRPVRDIDAERLEFVEGSILDGPTLDRCMEGCRLVFHLGALPSVPRSIEHPVLYQQVNVMGTLYVLEAARNNGAKRVVFAASSSAYGNAETLPKVETMAPLPLSPYAANKLSGEHLLRAYAASYEIDTASLRYFNIFGPRQNANSAYAGAIAAFAKALVCGRRPVIFGDGEQSRDFTFVDNAVHATLLAARTANPLEGEVINVGSAKSVTINELASRMARLLDKPDLEPAHDPPRPGDVLHSLADLSRAERLIGYTPVVPFEEGLRVTVEWYREMCPWSE